MSSRHHWWPRALQRYWASDDGKIRWIHPDGRSHGLSVANENIGSLRRRHSAFAGGGWALNHEPAFQSADDSVHRHDGFEPAGRAG